MNLLTSFSEINWLSVIVATVLAFGIGGLWYSPMLFSNQWQKELKITREDVKDVNMAKIFGFSFLLNFISAIFLDILIGVESSLIDGLITGVVVSAAFIATALGTNYLFANRSTKLFLIDAGYFLVYYAVMGAVLGAW